MSHTTFVIFQIIIHFMKMHSYYATNMLFREELLTGSRKKTLSKNNSTEYPNDINLRDFCYYLVAPTLIYWHEFPRNEKIRWGFFVNKLMLAVLGGIGMLVVVGEVIMPIVSFGKTFIAGNLSYYCQYHWIWQLCLDSSRSGMPLICRSEHSEKVNVR